MISFITRFLFCIVLIGMLTPSAYSKEQQGLAMVGVPMMPRDFTHFNYANPDAPKGGTFRQAIIGNFDTLNPFS